MLRAWVVGICIALVAAAGGQLLIAHPTPWIAIGIEAGIVVLLIVFERGRYKPAVDAGSGTWEPTGERFKDPTSGELVDVYANPETGERDYRASP